MIKINSIKKAKNHTYFLTVTVGEDETFHVVTEDTILRYNLLKPQEITKQMYQELILNAEQDVLYQKAITYIDYQMRTIGEVKKHLSKTAKQSNTIQKVIDKLVNQGYLSDLEYAKQYIHEKMEFDLVGPRYIREKLIQKGIHFDLINRFLQFYDDDLQIKKIEQIIIKETRYPISKTLQKAILSIKQKLLTNGFDLELVTQTVQEHMSLIKEQIDETKLLEKEIYKITKNIDELSYEDKDKLIKKLLQKGYSYTVIKDILK